MEKNYSDPENYQTIIEELKNCEKHNDVLKLIDTVYPLWIVKWCPKFSDDYPSFTHNWNFISKKIGTKPLNVILVDYIHTDNTDKNVYTYKLLGFFCEILTAFGHCVRRKEEFTECTKCKSAVPSFIIYEQLKERHIEIPKKWSFKCSIC
jgi:hypothetical protein